MQIQLPCELVRFIDQKIADGKFDSTEKVAVRLHLIFGKSSKYFQESLIGEIIHV